VRLVIGALQGAEVAVPRTDRMQPMCAVWRRSVAEPLRSAFLAGERRLQNVLQGLLVAQISVNPQDLANVNTPGDLLQ
jgi:molybdopterin-guanine dinucleotide biosynthesis protein A